MKSITHNFPSNYWGLWFKQNLIITTVFNPLKVHFNILIHNIRYNFKELCLALNSFSPCK